MQEQAKALALTLVKDAIQRNQEESILHLERTVAEWKGSKKTTCSPAGFRRQHG